MPVDKSETVVAFRVPKVVKTKLQEIADEQGWTVSQLCRWIVMTATGADAGEAAIRSTAWALASVVQARMPVIWMRIADLVEHELGAALREAAREAMSPVDALKHMKVQYPKNQPPGVPPRLPIDDEVLEYVDEVPQGQEVALDEEPVVGVGGLGKKRRRGKRGGRKSR